MGQSDFAPREFEDASLDDTLMYESERMSYPDEPSSPREEEPRSFESFPCSSQSTVNNSSMGRRLCRLHSRNERHRRSPHRRTNSSPMSSNSLHQDNEIRDSATTPDVYCDRFSSMEFSMEEHSTNTDDIEEDSEMDISYSHWSDNERLSSNVGMPRHEEILTFPCSEANLALATREPNDTEEFAFREEQAQICEFSSRLSPDASFETRSVENLFQETTSLPTTQSHSESSLEDRIEHPNWFTSENTPTFHPSSHLGHIQEESFGGHPSSNTYNNTATFNPMIRPDNLEVDSWRHNVSKMDHTATFHSSFHSENVQVDTIWRHDSSNVDNTAISRPILHGEDVEEVTWGQHPSNSSFTTAISQDSTEHSSSNTDSSSDFHTSTEDPASSTDDSPITTAPSSISPPASTSEEVLEDPTRPQGSESHDMQQSKQPTPRELGILTARPKVERYRLRQARLESFEGWSDTFHIKKEDLVSAGFFYKGTADCATCFFCGGTLRGWDEGDDPRVEHCRFFPKCGFLQHLVGRDFVRTVQTLHEQGQMQISYEDVLNKLGMEVADMFHLSSENNNSIKGIEENTQRTDPVNSQATADHRSPKAHEHCSLSQSDQVDASHNLCADPSTDQDNLMEHTDKLRKIREHTETLKMQTTCKVCLEKPIEVVFLMCGHFVCCVDCACALDSCPVCREDITATVRAYLRK